VRARDRVLAVERGRHGDREPLGERDELAADAAAVARGAEDAELARRGVEAADADGAREPAVALDDDDLAGLDHGAHVALEDARRPRLPHALLAGGVGRVDHVRQLMNHVPSG
jgi:hypothetical protein